MKIMSDVIGLYGMRAQRSAVGNVTLQGKIPNTGYLIDPPEGKE